MGRRWEPYDEVAESTVVAATKAMNDLQDFKGFIAAQNKAKAWKKHGDAVGFVSAIQLDSEE